MDPRAGPGFQASLFFYFVRTLQGWTIAEWGNTGGTPDR